MRGLVLYSGFTFDRMCACYARVYPSYTQAAHFFSLLQVSNAKLYREKDKGKENWELVESKALERRKRRAK